MADGRGSRLHLGLSAAAEPARVAVRRVSMKP
jgi:hypothetical protein